MLVNAQRDAHERIFLALEPMWHALARGDARCDAAEARRFQRKPELQLLTTPPAELQKLSPYNWQNMSCG